MQKCLREKQAESREIAEKIAEFEAKGGKVKRCEVGETALHATKHMRTRKQCHEQAISE